jgi:hypothetical protein
MSIHIFCTYIHSIIQKVLPTERCIELKFYNVTTILRYGDHIYFHKHEYILHTMRFYSRAMSISITCLLILKQ